MAKNLKKQNGKLLKQEEKLDSQIWKCPFTIILTVLKNLEIFCENSRCGLL